MNRIKAPLIFLFVFLFAVLFTSLAVAQNKVVVIPLSGNELTGNASVDDVLKDKTFSNSSGTGLTGKRPPAPVEKTGQTFTNWTGDDGNLQKGVPLPTPRFSVHPTDPDPDVVTDNLTGLSWERSETTDQNWLQALAHCNDQVLFTGEPGGIQKRWADWCLPNVKELHSLINYQHFDPALSDSAGTGQASNGDPFYFPLPLWGSYWSSTIDVRTQGPPADDDQYWIVDPYSGNQGSNLATATYHVRCVHD